MDSRDIELRLRMAAPDEPAVLPPLRLAVGGSRVVRGAVRSRGMGARAQDSRLVLAVLALLLVGLALILGGALRLLDRPLDSLEGHQQDGFSIEWPAAWSTLAEGSLFQGDFTESGLSYERVVLVIASSSQVGCPSVDPSAGGPQAFPSGEGPNPALPTADPGVVCLRSSSLPEGTVRASAMVGQRTSGMADLGYAKPDTSEPTPESGWGDVIDERPARLIVATGSAAEAVGAAELRTWDILFPGSIDRTLRVRFDLAGPDLERQRADVDRIAHTIRFDDRPVALDRSGSASILRAAVDQAELGSGTDYYGCFPREPGSRDAVITGGPYSPLPGPVAVTCASSIEPSAAGVWRVELVASWPAGDGYPAGGLRDEIFLRPDGIQVVGYSYPMDDRPDDELAGTIAWLPMPAPSLPAPGDGPDDLAPGSLARILWPGQEPAMEPNPGDETLYPVVAGHLVYVYGDSMIVGGERWYRVQWENDGGVTLGTRWARATLQGRPMLAAVEPSCPAQPVDVERLVRLTGAERLICHGGSELSLGPVFLAKSPPVEPVMCELGGLETTCPTDAGSPAWLTVAAPTRLFGARGPTGPVAGLPAWPDPTLGTAHLDQWVQVTGHFDDASASTCSWLLSETSVDRSMGRAADEQVLTCRERFVITGVVPANAP